MVKYKVIARTVVFKEVGIFEAKSPTEAIDKANDEGDVELSLCHYCHRDVAGIELETFIVEESD